MVRIAAANEKNSVTNILLSILKVEMSDVKRFRSGERLNSHDPGTLAILSVAKAA